MAARGASHKNRWQAEGILQTECAIPGSIVRSLLKLSLVVNGLTTIINTIISLVLLLIAPLGLASVITLTMAIAVCTLVSGVAGDALLLWALPSGRELHRRLARAELPPQS
jgi:hypothetical protein